MNESLSCRNGGEVLGGMCRDGLAARRACRAQVQALYDCVENEPVANWICHPIGEYPALSTNTCSAENDAVGGCFGG